MKRILISVCVGIMVLVGTSSCGDSSDVDKSISGTHNIESKPFTITVQVYPTQMALNSAVRDLKDPNETVEGLARWTHPQGYPEQVSGCTVYVVRPSGVKDTKNLSTWGHELAHCVYGTYHPPGVR